LSLVRTFVTRASIWSREHSSVRAFVCASICFMKDWSPCSARGASLRTRCGRVRTSVRH